MTINYRDGREHQVGPITLKFMGLSEHGPIGVASISSRPGLAFKLDFAIAEAIARTIEDSADLWTAKENDTRLQAATGEERGNLRIDLTNDISMLGDVSRYPVYLRRSRRRGPPLPPVAGVAVPLLPPVWRLANAVPRYLQSQRPLCKGHPKLEGEKG